MLATSIACFSLSNWHGPAINVNGFEFEMNEQYGEPLIEGSYKLRNDIYDLEGDILIKKDDTIELPKELQLDSIMGYDVFKYKNLYMTTEDVIYDKNI